MSAPPNFSAFCEAACLKLWGEPNSRTARELRWNGGDAYSIKTFNLRKRAWYDHAEQRGGSTLDLVAYNSGKPKIELRGAAFFETWRQAHEMGIVPKPPPESGQGGAVLATFPYHDANGELLFEVVRFDTADLRRRFRQRRPDGAGGWVWNVKGVRKHVLYRLPQLIETLKADQRILVTEGEKDADSAVALGFAATTMPGGVGKWWPEYGQFFYGADVVIVSDNDAQSTDEKTGALKVHPDGRPVLPGQDHAAEVARHLRKVAARVRTIIFPQKDLTAWREAGGTEAALETLIDAAPDQPRPLDPAEDPDIDYLPEPSPALAVAPAFSDEALALAFAERHADELRYVAQWGQWLSWSGLHWRRDGTLHAFDLARQIAREMAATCKQKRIAVPLASAKTVAATERLAKADRRLAATDDQWDGCATDFNMPTIGE